MNQRVLLGLVVVLLLILTGLAVAAVIAILTADPGSPPIVDVDAQALGALT